MASLSQLPNEMIAEIWEHILEHILEPREIESFALASKHIYAIGRRFVKEHNELKRQYSLFETGPNTRASALAFLLKDVLLRPRVALYVTRLSIGPQEFCWQDSNGNGDKDVVYSKDWPKTRHTPYPEDDMALFVEAIQTASFVLRPDVEYWISRIKAGDEDPILALLSPLLPNLTTITLKNEAEQVDLCPETIQRIAEAESTTFLTRLTTVNLHNDFDYWTDYMDCDWLRAFITLPRMQDIHVKDMRVMELYAIENEQFFRPGSSNITELTLVGCSVGPKVMFQLLGSIKRLKKFSLVEPDEICENFEPFMMRAALLAHAKHSLESLRVTSRKIEGKLLGSLCHFTALRKLETHIHLLILGAELEELTGLLPASIEKLHLHIGAHRRPKRVSQLVQTFVKAKSRLLPNLRALKLSLRPKTGISQAGKELIQTLEETCRDVGIELTVVAG